MDYDPATDVVVVAYPDLHGYLLPEIKHTITQIVEVIKNYDIKKLLLDSTKTVISVPDEESRYISTSLASGFSLTRLQKVARLQSHSQEVEVRAEQNIEHIQATQKLPFQLRTFNDRGAAMDWLKEGNWPVPSTV
ncbi:hypothetical protein ACD591_11175 [Rufibacter glacialis]|uniref:STAS/SEC14 domain-containing protein n=1 Tax=Rufibacter glacialis TaxID=1259555 RepID=A0A5M8Q6X4_9BACT|nr:hypothetical protein [Rufibacter glacialis]KAA6431685.1 hypothetical protein FOE74_16320 [Rufibacter glacialis]